MAFGIFLDGLAVPAQLAGCGPKQSRHQAKQARFSAAIGAAQKKRAARAQGKVQMAEDHTLATSAEKVVACERRGVRRAHHDRYY